MIDVQEIQEEIDKLEHGSTTYNACNKLATLYTVRNNLLEQKKEPEEEPVKERRIHTRSMAVSGTEFLDTIQKRINRLDDILLIMDEHMEAIKAIYPKEYQAIIKRINNIE